MMIDLVAAENCVKADANPNDSISQAAFFIEENLDFVGTVYTVDIGLVNPFMLILHLNISIRTGHAVKSQYEKSQSQRALWPCSHFSQQ